MDTAGRIAFLFGSLSLILFWSLSDHDPEKQTP